MNGPTKTKINPLSRVPRQQRLVMAIRGAAGVGKSTFIRSMKDALDLGRLCIFDTERKGRLLRGVGVDFDALEIAHSDELPEFIDWALSGEGRDQNYGCFALDSWAAYFGSKHSEMIQAVRDKNGDPLAQPSAEELASDQMILQNVLRRLCIESGKCVVIADQIAARGKEAKEDNEVGRVLPMTASGLEYFVDVMVEMSLQERNGDILRVFQVIKSNSPAFVVGYEIVGDAVFQDFLDVMKASEGENLSFDRTKPAPAAALAADVPETLSPAAEGESSKPSAITLDALIAKAEQAGLSRAAIVQGAKIYHQQDNITHLTPAQLTDLDARLTKKIDAARDKMAAGAAANAQDDGQGEVSDKNSAAADMKV